MPCVCTGCRRRGSRLLFGCSSSWLRTGIIKPEAAGGDSLSTAVVVDAMRTPIAVGTPLKEVISIYSNPMAQQGFKATKAMGYSGGLQSPLFCSRHAPRAVGAPSKRDGFYRGGHGTRSVPTTLQSSCGILNFMEMRLRRVWQRQELL